MQKNTKTKPTKTTTNITTAAKPATAPAVTSAPALAVAVTLAEPKLSDRVTFWSQVEPSYSVRVLRSLADNYEAPSHGGKPMVLRAGRQTISRKQTREQLLATMGEEQKATLLAKERETRKTKRAERQDKARAAMKEQLRKEMEAERAGK